MAVNQFKIERLAANGTTIEKGLKFHTAQAMSDSITINNISLPLSGQDSTKTFSRNFGGFIRLLNVSFMLTNDTTDKSTEGASIITLSQQRVYLMEAGGIIQGVASGESQIDVKYKLTIVEDGATKTFIGSVEDINVGYSNAEATVMKGTLNFREAGL